VEPGATRILLVDDHPLFRSGLRHLLEDDGHLLVVAEAGSAAEAQVQLRLANPDLVILDISLPDGSGVDLLDSLRAQRPDLPVLFLSAHPESGFALPLLRAGAQGYLEKHAPPDRILEAVRTVVAGKRYLTPTLAQRLAGPAGDATAGHERLSWRELQVFTRIARGVSPATTAAELQLSVKTIGTYRTRILEKLGLASNAELAAYAVRNRLLDPAIH
jgi:two-component system, NarL family, invasion response regulator UvrY